MYSRGTARGCPGELLVAAGTALLGATALAAAAASDAATTPARAAWDALAMRSARIEAEAEAEAEAGADAGDHECSWATGAGGDIARPSPWLISPSTGEGMIPLPAAQGLLSTVGVR